MWTCCFVRFVSITNLEQRGNGWTGVMTYKTGLIDTTTTGGLIALCAVFLRRMLFAVTFKKALTSKCSQVLKFESSCVGV